MKEISRNSSVHHHSKHEWTGILSKASQHHLHVPTSAYNKTTVTILLSIWKHTKTPHSPDQSLSQLAATAVPASQWTTDQNSVCPPLPPTANIADSLCTPFNTSSSCINTGVRNIREPSKESFAGLNRKTTVGGLEGWEEVGGESRSSAHVSFM